MLTEDPSLPPPSLSVMGEGSTPNANPNTSSDRPFWLSAWKDHLAGLRTYANCVELADINGDGNYKLAVAESTRRMKVFSGVSLGVELALVAPPTAVTSFYMDYNEEIRRPFLVVASGPFLFLYKDLTPKYRFQVPLIELTQIEKETWEKARTTGMTYSETHQILARARDEGNVLSNRSAEFLSFESEDEKQKYFEKVKVDPLQQTSVITCVTTLLKDKDEQTALGCLVIGTEHKFLYIMDSAAQSIIKKIQLPSVPVHIIAAGLYDVEYRILIACRNSNVYAVKSGVLQATCIEPESQPVGLARYENLIAIATMSNAVHYYHLKGKKHSSLYMPCPVTNICSLTASATRQARGIIIALSNGEIRVYAGKTLLSTTRVYDAVVAMKFGRYGREDQSLIIILKSGALIVKMLPRTASIEPNATTSSTAQGPPPEQDVPLRIPKRTNLYVEQTEREKLFGTDMHRMFQRDLCRLRLTTARTYVKLLTDGQSSTSYAANASVRLTAQVQGLGPLFRVKLNLQNTGAKSLIGVTAVFSYPPSKYRMTKTTLQIPCLIPGLLYTFEIVVECIETGAPNATGGPSAPPAATGDSIKVCLINPHSSIPILTALVSMPAADMLLPP